MIDTRTPILYLHFTLGPGARVRQPVPSTFNVFAYGVRGDALLGPDGSVLRQAEMAMFAADGDTVTLAAPDDAVAPVDVLLIGGVPLREQVARYGPFVMNTREEILQAFKDYQDGKMGAIQAQP